MRTGRPKVALILTEDERRRLDSLAHRSRSAPHVARRARIILACADGAANKVVARRLHVTPATVVSGEGASSGSAWTACMTSRGPARRGRLPMTRSSR